MAVPQLYNHNNGMKRFISLLPSLLLLTVLLPVFSQQAHADGRITCNQYTIPVTLSPTDQTVYHVVTSLCSQGTLQGKTVQILIHGGTYNNLYWNFPLSPENYSYVRKATDEGYVTFDLDLPGAGQSDFPPGASVTTEANAFVIHQLIQDVRGGKIGGVSFQKVISVSHSIGGTIAVLEASNYADVQGHVDGVILSGFMHTDSATGGAALGNTFYPANQDPKFGSSFPTDYFTTVPGTRESDFYNTSDADSQVIAEDETLKDVVSLGELNTFNDASDPSISQRIHVPVFLAVGQNDLIFCDKTLSCADAAAIQAREAADWSTHACLETFVLPNAGHSINLHLNAHTWFEAAISWANRRVGNSISNPPTQPCS
jgi:pimeloyl-ACP methyl ester carboxylesterase